MFPDYDLRAVSRSSDAGLPQAQGVTVDSPMRGRICVVVGHVFAVSAARVVLKRGASGSPLPW